MGLQGVKTNISDHAITETLRETEGNIQKACRILGMSHFWLYQKIHASPELTKCLKDLRAAFDERQIQKHEDTLDWISEHEQREQYPSLAVNAAMKYLDSTKFKHAPDARQGQAASKLDDICGGIATRAADIGDYDA